MAGTSRAASSRCGEPTPWSPVPVLHRTPPHSPGPQQCRLVHRSQCSITAGTRGSRRFPGTTPRRLPRATGAPDAPHRPGDGPAPTLVNRSRLGTADTGPRPAPARHGALSGRHAIGPAGATATSRPCPSDLHGYLEISRKPHNAGRPVPRPLGTRSRDRVPSRPEASRKNGSHEPPGGSTNGGSQSHSTSLACPQSLSLGTNGSDPEATPLNLAFEILTLRPGL